MSDTIIQVENLSKKYILGHQQEGSSSYKSLRETIANGVGSLFKGRSEARAAQEEFWALKDVSFEIKQGDRVGIIGRNGAGKSTLLKVLSRITEPTDGSIRIKGRIASLLEVGTGFHPELTGRENIFLNGAILGMSKVEITRKFDEIVAFAEVEKFLDTPVKRYSSGMYVRLAFAVAAHLEPEILIVDEVLAVGDAQFQQKCLGKMEDVGREGRTVIFVSHNIGTITQLCTQAIYLKQGQMVSMGSTNEVVSNYLLSGSSQSARVSLHPKAESSQRKSLFFKEVSLVGQDGQYSSDLDVRYPFSLDLTYEIRTSIQNAELSVRIEAQDGRAVFTSHQSDLSPTCLDKRNVGTYKASIQVPGMFLMPGSYLVSIAAHEPMVQVYDVHEKIIGFRVSETGTKFAKYQKPHEIGVVIADLNWVEKCAVPI